MKPSSVFFKIILCFYFALLISLAYAKDHSDAEIASNIQSKLEVNKTTSDLKIEVISNNGAVALIGHVDTDDEASLVIEIAESIAGVKSTDASKLIIKKSEQPFTDLAITAKVKGAFIREKLFGDKDTSVSTVAVETKDGIVHLTGSVETPEEAENAMKIAKSIQGVKNVDSNVQIKPNVTPPEEDTEW